MRQHLPPASPTASPTASPRRLGLACLALSLVVAACGNDDASEPAAVRTAANGDLFNDADVEFASAMVPHHAQALEMVGLTVGRDLSSEVLELAATIREAQAPEVEQMTDWLTAWDEPVPETSLNHANAHSDGHDLAGTADADGPGMMTAAEIDELEAATDTEFEPLFLEMMIEHHEGAIEMAQTERSDGEHPDAIALAASIEASQTEGIETMERLLGS